MRTEQRKTKHPADQKKINTMQSVFIVMAPETCFLVLIGCKARVDPTVLPACQQQQHPAGTGKQS